MHAIFVRPQPPRAKPIDPNITFQSRWSDSATGAPMEAPRPIRIIKTVRIPKPPAEPVEEVKEVEQPIGQPVVEQPVRNIRHRQTRSDVCRAHGMRKVMVGKYKWRCKR